MNEKTPFTFQKIYQAYLDCRKNKRNTRAALAYECNQEENIVGLVEALNDRSYRPVTSACFYIDQPKAREIFAADFRDRVVHHFLYTELAPIWEKIFIVTSFACRPGKGTHKAARVLQAFLRKVTLGGKRPAYYLKMDIRNFFMSINKQVLYELLCRQCPNNQLKWLLRVLIFHDPTSDYEMKGNKRLQKKVPLQKSLFHVLEECGLPIGNLTSQFFANVYLNALDHFVKHVLKCRFYLRYVDDFILLSTDINELYVWKQKIIQFLDKELLLSINPSVTKIDRVFNGVDFVGFIVRPFYTLCRRRVIGNCKRALAKYRDLLVQADGDKITWNYDFDCLEQLLATMNSYLGHFNHANTRNVIAKIFKDYSFLTQYFKLKRHKLVRKYKYPRSITNLKNQIQHSNRLFYKDLVLIQVGCYYEAFSNSAVKLSAIMGYKLRTDWRGFYNACGFHQRQFVTVCDHLEQHKISYTVIKPTGKYLIWTLERRPAYRVEFMM